MGSMCVCGPGGQSVGKHVQTASRTGVPVLGLCCWCSLPSVTQVTSHCECVFMYLWGQQRFCDASNRERQWKVEPTFKAVFLLVPRVPAAIWELGFLGRQERSATSVALSIWCIGPALKAEGRRLLMSGKQGRPAAFPLTDCLPIPWGQRVSALTPTLLWHALSMTP